jgi:tetratricopeptide (TPR) repeat protein
MLSTSLCFRLNSRFLQTSSGGHCLENNSEAEGYSMLKHLGVTLVAIAALSLGNPFCYAQSALLDLPRDSQHSVVTQRIGITDITIKYSRPLVKGRTIWGKLVPYDQVWRTGANENTTITFTDPASIEGKALAKGTYALFAIPGENQWTIIFSKTHTAWGSFTYKEADDALRVTVKPQAAEPREALTYDFDDLKPDSVVATLRWEKLAVPFKIDVNVHDIVQASLHNQLQGLAQYTWEGWDDAATYLLTAKYDLDEALQYEETSIRTEPRFDNYLTKSQILEAMGRKDDAEVAKNKALERATAAQIYTYGRLLQGQGKQDQAFDFFRQAAKKDPNDWVVHDGTARIYSAKGDFDNALKEAKLVVAGAPDNQKIFFEPLVKKLEAKQDINKQ